MILRVPEKDLPRLSSYLRGSTLHLDAVEFDSEAAVLRVGLERPAPSATRAERWLARLPLLPHGEATCLLTVPNVIRVDYGWRHPLGRIPQLGHELNDVRLEQPSTLVIATGGVRIAAQVDPYEPVELTDTAEPASRMRLADLFGRVGYDRLTHEVERSRVDA